MLDNSLSIHTITLVLTPHAKTVDALLRQRGISLEDFIGERRQEGRSYNRIAKELESFTDGVVEVTGQTVINWEQSFEKVAS